MAFARHETFYIRDGWLRKGLKFISDKKNEGFEGFRSDIAPEVLGMGKNMVSSLKFWLQATKMVESLKEGKKAVFEPSRFSDIILKYDPYFEDEGTLWLIHYNLVVNKNYSTTWYWFFNIFNHKEFDEETFLYWLKSYTITEGHTVAESSLKKDFNCFISSYLFEKDSKKHNSPEDNMNCPLRELRLLRKNGPKTYRLNSINRTTLDPLIVFYVIKKSAIENEKPLKINISDIIEKECNAGKVFNMSYEDIIYYLEKLHDMNMLTVVRTAGLDAITLQDIKPEETLVKYYEKRSEGDRNGQ